MTSTSQSRPLGDVPEAFIALLQAQTKLGQQLFETFTGAKTPATDSITTAWKAAANSWQSALNQVNQTIQIPNLITSSVALPLPGTSACRVPPPCWMPRSLGECTSFVSNCSTASVRIVVTNCDRLPHDIHLRTDGVEGVTITPDSATVNPMRRATFDVSLKIPEETDAGKQFESIVWVDGCNQHYLRWTVVVGPAAFDSCHEVAVSDCPDYRHHWYDHFYCVRPCNTSRGSANG